MKKTRLISLAAAAALAVTSLSMAVFAEDSAPAEESSAAAAETYVQPAADNEHTVTITKKDKAAHTFEAYQIFTGVLTGNKKDKTDDKAVMTEIKWGKNIDPAKLAAAIEKEPVVAKALEDYNKEKVQLAEPYADNPVQFAAFVSANNSKEFAEAIANVFSAALTGTPAGSAEVAKGETAKSGDIAGLTTGYYLIKDKADSLANLEGAYTDFVLQLVNNVEVDAKADAPGIDKKITDKDGTNPRDGETASIGDTVYYQLTSKVPDMAGYKTYYFIAGDKMCDGLTFLDDVSVKIGENDLEDTAFYVNQPGRDGKTFEVVLKNFIQYKDLKDEPITITYSALLNENCDRTIAGNPNEVDLLFSNDPNYDYKGKPSDNPDEPNNPDEPGPNEPTGKTPKSETKVYTTGIRVLKLDESKKPLTGAKFKLTGAGTTAVISLQSKFEEDAAGTYYKLANGTYTTTKPTEKTKALYESDKTYKLVEDEESVEMVAAATESGEIEAWVDKDGYLVFSGLGDGEYTIQETEAPNGYNIDNTEYKVTITSAPTFEAPNWKVNGKDVTPAADNSWTVFTQEIINKKGIILPSTGGIGTVVFYVVGSLLIAGAVVLFVNKKKKAAK